MSRTTAKRAVTANPHARMTFTTSSKMVSNGYAEWSEEVRTPEPDTRDAVLVGSNNEFGEHLPALDIDGPVALVSTPEGYALWLGTGASRLAIWRLRRTLIALGVSPSSPVGFSRAPSDYERERHHALDPRAARRDLVADRNRLGGSFGDLLERAYRAQSERERVVAAPMAQPLRLPLQVPALLVASTQHHHLYLEHALTWKQYKRLLRALWRAGLIEEGFCRLSIKRQASFLRLPWITKKY